MGWDFIFYLSFEGDYYELANHLLQALPNDFDIKNIHLEKDENEYTYKTLEDLKKAFSQDFSRLRLHLQHKFPSDPEDAGIDFSLVINPAKHLVYASFETVMTTYDRPAFFRILEALCKVVKPKVIHQGASTLSHEENFEEAEPNKIVVFDENDKEIDVSEEVKKIIDKYK